MDSRHFTCQKRGIEIGEVIIGQLLRKEVSHKRR
jgi:hypothetical protein